ncbi:hypothetical protein ABIE27_006017 [Paenibacillus sp. 4624]|uniref:hypothetical protein n=1 Tax=Paenibacillus sp. 4624 TaxID=3156453 RepID=UPI003D1C6CCB
MEPAIATSPKDAANQLHELVKYIKDQFDHTASSIGACDGEAADLTHAFELLGPEEIDPTELLWQYQENRRRRRHAKEENEQWRALYEVVVKLGLIHYFSQAKREVRSIIKTQSARHYTVKNRNDLQSYFDRAKLRNSLNNQTGS